MIELRNHVRIAVLISPLLVLPACGSHPDDAESDQSAVVFTGGLSLNLQSVIEGTALPTDNPTRVGISFMNFTVPAGTSQFPGPGSVDLGTCLGYSQTQTCGGLQLPRGSWTKAVAVDTAQPTQTITYVGQLSVEPRGLGAPLLTRCFHFGLDTKTYKLKSVPTTSLGCTGEPDDRYNPVTCDGTTCTASISVTGGRDPVPWKVKFGYNVQVPTITGHVTLTPDFFISNVYYAPPGKSSSIAYSSTTSVGTSTSVTKSFQGSLKVTATVGTTNKFTNVTGNGGSVAVSEGRGWGDSQMDQLDISVDTANGYKIPGQVDGVDHNNDEIWLLIRPQLLATYTQPIDQTMQSSMTWQFAPNQDGLTNAIPYKVYVGWLNGQVPMPANVKQVLDSYGITSSYYQQILSADPLATGAVSNPQADLNRFNFIQQFPFEPPLMSGGQPTTQTFMVTQKQTTTSTSTSTDSWTTGFTITGSSDLNPIINLKLMTEGSFTWTNSSSQKLSNGTTTMDTLIVGQPQFGYLGPTLLKVYEDTIYKTYVFALDPVCGGTGDGTEYCNQGTGQQCVSTVWGFEPGEAFAWGNSAETSSSLATEQAHSGAQSLRVSASSDPSLPASINTTPCFNANQGTMDLRGQTYGAWIYVPTSTSSYAGTSCRLRAFDSSFHESAISTQATRSPITPGSWFHLSGVFPFTPVEAQIYELTVDCTLPSDWTLGDPTKVWYVDDVSVGLMAQ